MLKLMVPWAVMLLATGFATAKPLNVEATKNRVRVTFGPFEGSADQVSFDAEKETLTFHNVDAAAKSDKGLCLVRARRLVYSLGGRNVVLSGVAIMRDNSDNSTADEWTFPIRK